MKGVAIPHLAKESTGVEASLLSKPTGTVDQRIGRHGENWTETAGSGGPRRREVVTGTRKALLSKQAANHLDISNTVDKRRL